MKIQIENNREIQLVLLRRAGYVYQRNEGDELSFVRPLAQAGYPRFHIFTKQERGILEISIHLDQKKETYGSGTRHHGEYTDEGVLKEEIERIKKIIH